VQAQRQRPAARLEKPELNPIRRDPPPAHVLRAVIGRHHAEPSGRSPQAPAQRGGTDAHSRMSSSTARPTTAMPGQDPCPPRQTAIGLRLGRGGRLACRAMLDTAPLVAPVPHALTIRSHRSKRG
jgi:hypothetical protein